MNYNIALIKGDGIGPEIVDSAVKVLDKIEDKFGHKFSYQDVLAGGCQLTKQASHYHESVDICLKSDSVLLGAVGGLSGCLAWSLRPERALLGIRKALAFIQIFAQRFIPCTQIRVSTQR